MCTWLYLNMVYIKVNKQIGSGDSILQNKINTTKSVGQTHIILPRREKEERKQYNNTISDCVCV